MNLSCPIRPSSRSLQLSIGFVVAFVAIGVGCVNLQSSGDEKAPLKTLAFGSCNRQDLPQPLWPLIKRDQPQVFMWTGDVVYVDDKSEKSMRRSYDEQLLNAGYSSLLAEPGISVIGVWDDNDYGMNNGGSEYSKKALSQKVFLDFLGEPKTSKRRKQKGIYASYDYGPKEKLVRVILLDDRYHKQPLNSSSADADILGEAQWQWLKSQLENSPAKVHVVVSGIQFLSQEHKYETWGQYPRSWLRLASLFKQTKPSGLVLISGDRHIAEVSRENLGSKEQPVWVYDVTSSGMTHSYEGHKGEKNSRRVGEVYKQINYGRLRFDWSGRDPKVVAEVVGVDGSTVLSAEVVR